MDEDGDMDVLPQKTMRWPQMSILTLCSAVLAVTSFPPCQFSSLIWIALVPWLYCLPMLTIRQTFLSHAIFLCTFFLIGVWWMVRVHLSCPFLLLIPLYFICMPFPFIFRWAVKGLNLPIFLAAPVIWTAGEYFRSFILTGFPWLFLGHTQAFYPVLIQIADITGVYGVSFVIVMVNGLIVSWCQYWAESAHRKLSKQIVSTAVATSVILLVMGYGWLRLRDISHQMGPKIIAIQGNIPQDIKEDARQNRETVAAVYERMSVDAVLQHPDADMLVWPETMAISDPLTDTHILLKLQDLARRSRMHLLIGSHHLQLNDEKKVSTYNSAYLIDPRGKFLERYDKMHLVILGEYLPLQNSLPFLPQIVRKVAGFLPNLSEGESRPVFRFNGHRFGTLICYDIVYATDARELRRQGCQFLLNVTNEGWFFQTGELEQILAISIFRAVENRIGILRAGNTGITGNIHPTGKIVADQLLAIDYRQYASFLHEYTPFIENRIIGKRALAWHHLPSSLWRRDTPLIAQMDLDWDVKLNGKRLKWKDFPGIFCHTVPLATDKMPMYTRIGDLFAQILCLITSVMLLPLCRMRQQKKVLQES